MAYYQHQVSDDHGKTWLFSPCKPRNGLKAVESFIQAEMSQNGLDWRVGLLYKLRADSKHYRFVKKGDILVV